MAGKYRAVGILGAVVVAGFCWWAVEGGAGPFAWAQAQFNQVTGLPPALTTAVVQPPPVSPLPANSSPTALSNGVADAASAVASAGNSRFAAQTSTPVLTRQLEGEQKVTYGGRERTVLGTKEVGAAATAQTVLLIRDEKSGQIDYWQPGLRIELKPGFDYSAFIAEYGVLNRRFVNSMHADVGVDAAEIARAHAQLTADPRVASVQFLSLNAPVKAR